MALVQHHHRPGEWGRGARRLRSCGSRIASLQSGGGRRERGALGVKRSPVSDAGRQAISSFNSCYIVPAKVINTAH